MAGGRIHVDEASLARLREALSTSGEEYKTQLVKLENLINTIVKGDIQGDPAQDLLQKFMAKKDIFEAIARIIDDAESYVGVKKTSFTDLISNLAQEMK